MTIREAMALIPQRSDAEVLLAHVLHWTRTQVIAHPEHLLNETELSYYRTLAERRLQGEPVAYLVGSKEFFGHNFIVDHSTLIPRPCTESLVEMAIAMCTGQDVLHCCEIDTSIVAWSHTIQSTLPSCIVDIGTGTGCIGISVCMALPHLHCIATDVSADACAVARKNVEAHDLAERIEIRRGHAFEPLDDLHEPFLLVSNPPYIPTHTPLERDVAEYEPSQALYAEQNGLALLQELVEKGCKHPFCVGILLECRADQAGALDAIVERMCASAITPPVKQEA